MSKCHYRVQSLKGREGDAVEGGNRAFLSSLMGFSLVVVSLGGTFFKPLEGHMS